MQTGSNLLPKEYMKRLNQSLQKVIEEDFGIKDVGVVLIVTKAYEESRSTYIQHSSNHERENVIKILGSYVQYLKSVKSEN